ncbi:MAG: hypothetical protein A2700_00775 [Candidatus Blackburnbacteria bacterium RIFCSPHIGHO2_01_FULL_44_64]|uniref:Uncharacterized protein n=1 Tax=Candidatus Blackburnbacteria bacterium RIFCSPHIGHO2_02_FULL_44_20 TaxID=1797516 RepID=A0A1G1V562_9BACT|nr:MAG: hypothetical protein A2700_00775 [Candidatus Blackburnbacteria bacterium RIFCSPHIGHO2_01_FULL_44_64]OGY10496.1 MAG: hypothetical protein A3D26_00145 [Candidatus Blackburnbacteria bacterium RIFCSPHIGHO2_02_FULL_44_20]OGY12309.1 MAG: hypothetical protein A3E16_00505 [Candidatus Blackburnbacteria bacterium RIFCSPHIGHO2_12_FULL_44_25]OGY15038.1 MAG: hypothetical protein A3A62_02120 [Candidatus Blackburnbacteria bacterium RIFCSPLOWO2_01_FULL_44_43]OGY17294.1 MAG: hypothetical protein A3H88_0
MSQHLSYLMGAEEITDTELKDLNIEIVGKTETGSRKIKIPTEKLPQYLELIKAKLTEGFWNEVVGEKKIIFVFKFKDGSIKELVLSPETEAEIAKLCSELNDEKPEDTANVYKYLSEDDFYHDFVLEHYQDMINR